MREEVFNLQSSLPTSPTPPPDFTPFEGTDRGGAPYIQENGVNASIVSSSPRSVSPLPLPPPNPDLENPYILTAESNHYTLEPLSFSNQMDPLVSSIVNMGYTDQVHDFSGDDFEKLAITDIFEAGTPEVFDRLEGFEPVHTMPTFDIITTGGEGGGDSRDQSPATTTSLVNQTPEPQSDHRVTFAPAVITISPEPYTNEVTALGMNVSNCNNHERFVPTRPRGGVAEIFNFPPVAEIVEGEELRGQVEH